MGYLTGSDKQTEDMFFRLTENMAEHKSCNRITQNRRSNEWVAWMNDIRSKATETVNNDLYLMSATAWINPCRRFLHLEKNYSYMR